MVAKNKAKAEAEAEAEELVRAKQAREDRAIKGEDLKNQLFNGLEPTAGDIFDGRFQIGEGTQEACIISMALSLKRIADALQPTNESGMNSISESLHGLMLNGRQNG